MLISPDTFASVIVGALRLGKVAYQAELTSQLNKARDFTIFVPKVPPGNLQERGDWAQDWCLEVLQSGVEWQRGKRFDGVFALNENGTLALDSNLKAQVSNISLFEIALADMLKSDAVSSQQVRSSLIEYHRHLWADETNGSPWAEFFREFLNVGFTTLSMQPAILGIGGNTEKFLVQLMPNLAACFDAEASKSPNASLATQLANTFAHAALQTVVDNPSLVASEKRWQPLVTGVLSPLQEQVTRDGAQAAFAEANLRRMLTGPMAHGLLSAVNSNVDLFLKGDLKSDRLLGVVARQTLGAAVATGRDGLDVSKLFTDAAALQVFDATLRVARDRPELFIRGDGEDLNASRSFLADLSRTLVDAPKPFGSSRELAPALATITVDAVGAYASMKLKSRITTTAQGELQIDLAQHLLRALMDGLKDGLHKGGIDDDNALSRVFSRSGALEIVQLLASHVAKSPHLLVDKDSSPQIKALAQAVARAIEADTTGLLSEDQWRMILVMVLDAALANPGRLFSLDPAASATDSIALQIINTLLDVARKSLEGRTPGFGDVMFGETLGRIIEIAIAAASSGALALAKKEGKLLERLNQLVELCRRLNTLARETDPEKIISSVDWLAIFEAYAPGLLTTGKLSISDLADDVLLAVLKQ